MPKMNNDTRFVLEKEAKSNHMNPTTVVIPRTILSRFSRARISVTNIPNCANVPVLMRLKPPKPKAKVSCSSPMLVVDTPKFITPKDNNTPTNINPHKAAYHNRRIDIKCCSDKGIEAGIIKASATAP